MRSACTLPVPVSSTRKRKASLLMLLQLLQTRFPMHACGSFGGKTRGFYPTHRQKTEEFADVKEIDFYMDKINNPSNDEILKTASQELMILCGEYTVTNHKVLQFLKVKLTDPTCEIVHLNLLHSVRLIVQNTSDAGTFGNKSDFQEFDRRSSVE